MNLFEQCKYFFPEKTKKKLSHKGRHQNFYGHCSDNFIKNHNIYKDKKME